MQYHNTFPDSSAAIAAILSLHFPEGTILDVNYGLGVFYKQCGPRAVTGVDIRDASQILGFHPPTAGYTMTDNAALPFADDSFDIGVVDPPYKRGNGNTRYTERYGAAPRTEQQCTRLYLAALPELLRVCRRGLIIKCQDGTDGHGFYPRHIQLAAWMQEKTGLAVHDIAAVVRSNVPDANVGEGKGRPRHFFQQSMSYFLIYRWRQKSPFKPVRF
jgi:hypothetical protein